MVDGFGAKVGPDCAAPTRIGFSQQAEDRLSFKDRTEGLPATGKLVMRLHTPQDV